jgi:hypothetical protein
MTSSPNSLDPIIPKTETQHDASTNERRGPAIPVSREAKYVFDPGIGNRVYPMPVGNPRLRLRRKVVDPVPDGPEIT